MIKITLYYGILTLKQEEDTFTCSLKDDGGGNLKSSRRGKKMKFDCQIALIGQGSNQWASNIDKFISKFGKCWIDWSFGLPKEKKDLIGKSLEKYGSIRLYLYNSKRQGGDGNIYYRLTINKIHTHDSGNVSCPEPQYSLLGTSQSRGVRLWMEATNVQSVPLGRYKLQDLIPYDRLKTQLHGVDLLGGIQLVEAIRVNYWFTQYNPDYYDLIEAGGDPELEFKDLWPARGEERLKAHAKALKEGDICLFVRSGEEKGIVGFGIVTKSIHKRTLPETYFKHLLDKKEKDSWDPELEEEVIEISYEQIFSKPIIFQEFHKYSDYQQNIFGRILSMPRETFYKIPIEAWNYLHPFIQKRLLFPIDYLDTLSSEKKHLEKTSLIDDPDITENPKITTIISQQRVREYSFSQEIKKFYNYSCAVCGKSRFSLSNQPEVEAAHIYPKRLNGTDDYRNGLALCKLHHWALDNGLLGISDNYHILVREEIKNDNNYEEIYGYEDRSILLPTPRIWKPHPVFLSAHREEIFSEKQ